MVTNFPAAIDSFDLKLPQQVIESKHINDLQESLVAVQVFVKALEESLDNHVLQDEDAHDASAISVNTIAGVDTTNTQTALADLKAQIDVLDATITALTSSTASDLASHEAEDIDTAHPNGNLPGSRIDNSSITGSKIALGEITEAHLAFDTANQTELNTHLSTDIATAHPSGNFPISRLDTDVATQAEFEAHTTAASSAHQASAIELSPTVDGYDNVQGFAENTSTISAAHISASTGVHGIGSASSVVGTETAQLLENKTIISDFEGSKVILFSEDVYDEERDFYNLVGNINAHQLELRNKSIELIASIDNTGPETILTVADSYFFTDVVNISDGVEFYDVTGPTLITTAEVIALPTSTTVQLDAYYPLIETSHIVVNTVKAKPLFSVSPQGEVVIRELQVEGSAFQDIDFNDNVTITGTLDISGVTTLGDNLNVTGDISATGSIDAGTSMTAGTSLTVPSIFATDMDAAGDTTIGGSLDVVGLTTLDSNLEVGGSIIADGYANIGSDATILGGLTVSNFFSAGNSASVGGDIVVSGDGFITEDLEVCGDLHVKGTTILDGYTTIHDNLLVNGILTATAINYDAYDGYWADPDPTTIADAILRIANRLVNGGSGPL